MENYDWNQIGKEVYTALDCLKHLQKIYYKNEMYDYNVNGRKLSNLYDTFSLNFRSGLDDVVCRVFPDEVHKLPHTCVEITSVFYRSTLNENNEFIPTQFNEVEFSKVIDRMRIVFYKYKNILVEASDAGIFYKEWNKKTKQGLKQLEKKLNTTYHFKKNL